MATPTKDIRIWRYGTPDGHQQIALPMTANLSLYAGTVAVTRAGFLIDPSVSVQSTDVVWGVILGQSGSNPNVSTPIVAGSTNGATLAEVETGTFYMQNSTGGDAIAAANLGAAVFLLDHQTVTLTNNNGSRPFAGRVVNIDSTQGGGIAVTLGGSVFGAGVVPWQGV